jgi:hypothetical protein
VSEQNIYAWKKKYHNMTVSDAKKLRELEAENLRCPAQSLLKRGKPQVFGVDTARMTE